MELAPLRRIPPWVKEEPPSHLFLPVRQDLQELESPRGRTGLHSYWDLSRGSVGRLSGCRECSMVEGEDVRRPSHCDMEAQTVLIPSFIAYTIGTGFLFDDDQGRKVMRISIVSDTFAPDLNGVAMSLERFSRGLLE
ncbi:MAG: hypothetical protein AAF357_09795 [Verrucomicrobiota bacterium]